MHWNPSYQTTVPTVVEFRPWDRQPEETEDEYTTFYGYLHQAPPRRLLHCTARMGTGRLYQVAADWNWGVRVAAYDRHVHEIREQEREALLREDERSRTATHLSMLKGVQQVVQRELAKLVRDTAKSEAFGTVRVSDLNKLLTQSVTLERLVRGESTENVAMVDVDITRLTVDELRELQRLQAKMVSDPKREDK